MTQKVRLFAILPVFALILSLAACSRQEQARNDQPPAVAPGAEPAPAPPRADVKRDEPAMVRMVNAIPGGPSVDAMAGEHKAFNGVAYKQVTPYKEVANADNVKIARTGKAVDAEPLATSSKGFDGGKHYTLVALPDGDTGADIRVLEDDPAPAPEGKAKIRIVNAARDAGDIDVFLKNRENSLFSGLGFTTWGSGYKEVEPAQGPLMIKSEKDDQPRTVANVNLAPGKAYTIILTGNKGRVDMIRIEDNPAQLAHESGAARNPERRRSAY